MREKNSIKRNKNCSSDPLLPALAGPLTLYGGKEVSYAINCSKMLGGGKLGIAENEKLIERFDDAIKDAANTCEELLQVLRLKY